MPERTGRRAPDDGTGPDGGEAGGEAPDRGARWPLPDLGRGPVDPPSDPTFFTPAPRAAAGPLGTPGFATVLRGYDRGQVDDYVRDVSARTGAAENERRRAEIAEDQLREALTELKAARQRTAAARPSGPGDPPPDPAGSAESFGPRAERMLREAEREADQERAEAREAAARILARARSEAETHRTEVERALEERTAAAREDLQRREAELSERERNGAERLAAARTEAERVTSTAEADAARRGRELLAAAERDASVVRERVRREVDRLTRVRDRVHADLRRLRRELGEHIASGTDRGADPAADPAETGDRAGGDPADPVGPRPVHPLRS